MNNHFFEQKDCGLQAFWSSTPQFKTARVSAHLVLPLTTPENAALYALVPNIISRATREYPDYTQFGKRLAELYGASVQPGVTRVGDNQILTLAAAGIANPYASAAKMCSRRFPKCWRAFCSRRCAMKTVCSRRTVFCRNSASFWRA